MPRLLVVDAHLPVAELEQRYRACRDPVERSRWQMVWLVAAGHRVPEVAPLVGYTANWVREIIRRFNAEGPAGIADRRHANPGQPPLLSPALREELRQALVAPPPDGGLWTSRKVAAWMAERLDREVGEVRGWEAVRSLGFTPSGRAPTTPRPTPRRRPRSKRGLADAVSAVRTAHPDASVTVWAEDEHRLGLLPVSRRVWAPRGQRPIAHVRRRYQWRYVYGFVCPATGQNWWCLLPTVNAVAMSVALAVFARDVGVDATHRVALVWDGAGWHTATALVVPDGIDLIRMPPASPELQPAEHLWALVDEPVANRAFADLDELDAVLEPRCRVLAADRATIQSATHFHWWPEPKAGIAQ